MRATLTATSLSPAATTAFTTLRTAGLQTPSTTLIDIPNVKVSFITPRAGKALIFFQPGAASTSNQMRGEIALALDGTNLASAFVESEPAGGAHLPFAIMTLVDVPQGGHTLTTRYRTLDASNPIRLFDGVANLGAILLE